MTVRRSRNANDRHGLAERDGSLVSEPNVAGGFGAASPHFSH